MLDFEEIKIYKGFQILKYEGESGYRVDLGTMRSKLVDNVNDAEQLIDFITTNQ